MGQCCIPAGLKISPEVYSGRDSLPEDIIQVTDESDQALIDDLIGVISRSFCGTKACAPEPAISWGLDPKASGDNPTQPLLSEPQENRIKYFDFFAGYMVHSALRHGGCFVLKGPEGKVVAGTVTFPPNSKNLHRTGLCESMSIVSRMGGWSKVKTPELEKGDPPKREKKLQEAMNKAHKAHANGRHIYVFAFGVDVGEQGKGYGRKLLTFLTESAAALHVPVYLECSGERTERFYGNNGFEVPQRYPLIYKDQRFCPDKLEGMAAMVWNGNN